MTPSDLKSFARFFDRTTWIRRVGRIVEVLPSSVIATGLQAPVGAVCQISQQNNYIDEAEVTAVHRGISRLMPFNGTHGMIVGMSVSMISHQAEIIVGPELLGRVISSKGDPLDGKAPIGLKSLRSLENSVPEAMSRIPITRIASTGIKSIDAFLTLGVGQRIGIMAPAGVGKSTLMGMIAQSQLFDVVVVGLIGERGREVREFVEQSLGPEKLKNSIVICATSNSSAMERANAAKAATTIAEYFRDNGSDVLLMMDSLTRYARALREVGISNGELPTRRGYPTSVFESLPRLVERAGTSAYGSITAIYTLLADDETASGPITEEARSLLDGHIILSRQLASKGHFPAIDILQSVSRLMSQLADEKHKSHASMVRSLYSKYQEIEMLIQAGEYHKGQDHEGDRALEAIQQINQFLRQPTNKFFNWRMSMNDLEDIARS